MKRFSILTIALVAILTFAGSASAQPPECLPPGHCQVGGDGGSLGDFSVDTTFSAVNNTIVDYDFPVNTAAPVFAGNCAQGVSAQTMGFGGSIASGNSVCDFIAVAGAFIAGGERAEAFRVLGKAEKAADWRFLFSRIRMVITLGIL